MISTPMMLLLNTEDVLNHEEIRNSVREIAQIGCDAVCLEFRQSKYDEFDEIGQAAMHVAHDEARRLGIGFIKIMPHMNEGFIERHPRLRRRHILGKSVFLGAAEQSIVWNNETPDRLVRAFWVNRGKDDVIIEVCDKTTDIKWTTNGSAISVSATEQGEYLLYFSYETVELDYVNDDASLQIDEFLSVYVGYRLDGVALDEFGAGSCQKDVYLGNKSFLDRFRSKYGYDFLDKIYLMTNITHGTEFAKVRFDYYDLTIDATFNYQMTVKQRYLELFGEDIFVGFHHTWWGEGNSGDLWAGNIDYFRLSKVLSGGFVDAQYDSERTMLSMTAIAESLGKYSGTNRAYNMCWDRFATPAKVDYYHRLLAVRDVKWVGHSLAKGIYKRIEELVKEGKYDGLFCPGAFPNTIANNPHWGDISRCIHREHAFEHFIQGAPGKAKVAVLYLWESNAYFNNDYMHYHRLSLKALLDKLVMNNIPVDVVPSYETHLSSYDVIFALWPAMMPASMWETLKKEIADGKKVYFMGPPAYVTTDGKDISAEFEEIIGRKIDFTSIYMGPHEYPHWDLWFTDRVIPMVTYCSVDYPIEAIKGNVWYYGYDAPLTEAIFDIIGSLSEYRTVKSDLVISKEFQNGEERLVTLTARWNSRINESFTFDGNQIQIQNGLLVGIKSRNGTISDIISEGDACITVNGKEYSPRALRCEST